MSKNQHNFLKRAMKQVIYRLLKMSSLHFALQFLVVAMLVSVMIVLGIDFIWDGRFNAELEFAGVITPFLDGLFLVVFVNAMLDEIREELAWRKKAVEENRKQQALTTQIIEAIPLHIFWKDRDLRYLGCNTQFAQDAGHSSPDELTGKTDFEMVWKNQAELYRADDKSVMKSGLPRLNIEEPQTTPDGKTIWLSTSKAPLRDKSRQVIGLLGVYQDITERKKLELDKELYLKFFKLSINPMCIADPFGCFKQVNPAFVKLTGYSESELIAKPFLDFILPEDRQKTKDEMKLEVETRPTLYFDNRYICKDGTVIHLSWTAYYDKHDAITYATAVDITERKQAESAITEQLEELRRWHDTTLGREERILELKHEVNELLAQAGQSLRYPSAESQDQSEE